MAQYATPEDLASYLQQDLDASTANLLLTLASGAFAAEADTAFAATTVTYQTWGGAGTLLDLPYRPVTGVSAVRINGVVVTGWTLRSSTLYRAAGFGSTWATAAPDLVEVDLTYGYTTVPDDVRAAVLEAAAAAYARPVSAVLSEQVDDYSVRYAPAAGGVQLTDNARRVAHSYRELLVS